LTTTQSAWLVQMEATRIKWDDDDDDDEDDDDDV
jgi:hypothetical protein